VEEGKEEVVVEAEEVEAEVGVRVRRDGTRGDITVINSLQRSTEGPRFCSRTAVYDVSTNDNLTGTTECGGTSSPRTCRGCPSFILFSFLFSFHFTPLPMLVGAVLCETIPV